jgi:hypothetical protein
VHITVGHYFSLTCPLGFAAHFHFRSKRGKWKRKPFRLEPKKIQAKPVHPTVPVTGAGKYYAVEIVVTISVPI